MISPLNNATARKRNRLKERLYTLQVQSWGDGATHTILNPGDGIMSSDAEHKVTEFSAC